MSDLDREFAHILLVVAAAVGLALGSAIWTACLVWQGPQPDAPDWRYPLQCVSLIITSATALYGLASLALIFWVWLG